VTGDRTVRRVEGGRALGRPPEGGGPTGRIGVHRAPDGSDGAPLRVDLDRPHASLVVGKRGYGKSYTLGVIAEELARTEGVAPVVVDPMGVFGSLVDPAEGTPVPARVVETPRVRADVVDPPAWCEMLGLSPSEAVGALVWRAAERCGTLREMGEFVADADAALSVRRSAANHLELAAQWGVFAPEGLEASPFAGEVTVLDASGLDPAPANALVRAVAAELYARRVEGRTERLPWLLVDEAHAFFSGIGGPGLRRLLTRGRQPGVSLVVATQRPSALPEVVASQADLTVAHRLTARPDREALARVRPSYVEGSVLARTPDEPGEATVVDDATETVHTVRIRERDTPHGGASPRASEL
jgi:hypothetical protein